MNETEDQLLAELTEGRLAVSQEMLSGTSQLEAEDKTQALWQDYAGVVASVACAVHCAAMPLVIGFLPALGLSFLGHPSFHQWMAGICGVVALTAFLPGWRRDRNWRPTAVALTGLILITGTAFGLSDTCCEVNPNASAPSDITRVASPEDEKAVACLSACCHTKSGCESVVPGDSSASEVNPVVSAAAAIGAFAERHAAWWTPLGGLFLVAGHLLNRHYVCRCDCCA